MEDLLIEFVNTLDAMLKKVQAQVGDEAGVSKLTINQFHYIDAIHKLGQPTISELADQLKFSKASVTAGINKLILLGFVVKTQSAVDRRIFHVNLTSAGERLVQAKVQALKDYSQFITSALSEDEARQLEQILTKLVNLFKPNS